MLTPSRQDTHHADEIRLLVERAKVTHGKRLASDWTERSPSTKEFLSRQPSLVNPNKQPYMYDRAQMQKLSSLTY